MNAAGLDSKRRADKLFERANAVSIATVLADFCDTNVPSEGRSWKGWCPFGWEHSDGGLDRNWRVYPQTNTSYCFDTHGAMGPVKLVMMKREVPAKKAAYIILDKYGLSKPRYYKERWEELTKERAESTSLSAEYAVAALLSWAELQGIDTMDTKVLKATEVALDDLDAVLVSSQDVTEDAAAWFVRAQKTLGDAK